MIIKSKFNNGKIGYKNYNKINITIIKKELEKGTNRYKIAKRLNIGIDKLRRIIIKNNLNIKSSHTRVLKYKVKNINKHTFQNLYYNTNLSVKEICNKLNITFNIYQYLRQKYKCINKSNVYLEKNKHQILENKKIKKQQWKQIHKSEQWEKNRKYYYQKYHNDENYRFKEQFRNSIRCRIKAINGKKYYSMEKYLGCSFVFFKKYIEQQFRDGMSWENYGIKGWHLDHVIPCASFDLTKEEEQKKCFHYTNYQPLWWYENLSKRDKYVR